MELFERARIGTMEVKNRIAMAPMGTSGVADVDLGYSRRLIDFYEARARGGAGMIITGAAIVNTRLEGGLSHSLPRLSGPEYVLRLGELADAMHHSGAKLVLQLSAGWGRVNRLLGNAVPAIAASALPCFYDPSIITRPMTLEEINELMGSFTMAAGFAKMVGVDAIEIQGYGGYLIDQFMTSLWNQRTDQYGGDLDGRMRFALEIIAAIRAGAGADFPIIFKFTPDHYVPGGRTLDEGLEIARRLEKAGVDALHVDAGCYEVWNRVIPSMYERPACQISLAEAVKQVVNIPVMAHGKLGDPAVARQVIKSGKADFVAIGRPMLADPAWARKVKEGREEDIRPCLSCNEACLSEDHSISCAVNPQTGNERVYALTPIHGKKSVLVIGGGPGGLEAARVAAARGCKVTLWEKSAQLGGKLRLAGIPEFKRDIRPLTRYLALQVKKAGVKVKLNTSPTVQAIKRLQPDVVILATGSIFRAPDVPGVNGKNVLSLVDLFERGKRTGKQVLVVGAGLCGCEAAAHLAQQGKQVTVIEMAPRIVPEGRNANTMLSVQSLLAENKVEVLTSTKLVAITAEGASVERNGEKQRLAADSIVIATGFVADLSLRDALEKTVPEVIAIGDCAKPRNILNAIWEGFHTARVLE
jgi:2-enoate reductase